MPNLQWSKLNHLQVGRYGEYYAKMEFTSFGFEVYTSEVDDHGVDFIVKVPNTDAFYEVQVKTIRNKSFVSIAKSKMPKLTDRRLVCCIQLLDGNLPNVFVIPAIVWCQPNAVFRSHDYDKPGQKSKPEWGINISDINYDCLVPYQIETKLKEIMDQYSS